MADMHWSDEQLCAIRTRDRTLLISAAAGSGKTAVLTERVIRSLTEGAHPLDLSRILVTTFARQDRPCACRCAQRRGRG